MSDSCRCPLTAIKPETKRISNPIHHGTNSSASANLICNVPIECMIANVIRHITKIHSKDWSVSYMNIRNNEQSVSE